MFPILGGFWGYILCRFYAYFGSKVMFFLYISACWDCFFVNI